MDSGNVIVGYGYLYVAPAGTALPTLTGPNPPASSDWKTAGFTEAGFTDDGVQFTYTPTFKDIDVDESMSPIDKRLIGEKLDVSVKLAEATLLNLQASIAGSALTETGGLSTLTIGNPSNPDIGEIVLAFQGPAPQTLPGGGTLGRVFVVYRAKSSAAVTYHAQRKDKVILSVKWEALAKSSLAAGAQLAEIIDFTQTGS